MRRLKIGILTAFAALVLGGGRPAAAQPPPTPLSSYIFPAGARRGTTVAVRVGGEQVAPYSRLRMGGPGVLLAEELFERPPSRYVEPEPYHAPTMLAAAYPREWSARVTLAPDASVGPRAWRITSAQGGTSARLFVVGDLPELVETEPNSAPERGEAVSFPLTLNGQINPREDRDYFRLSLRAGQAISFEGVAQRIGSPADLVCEILDGAGRMLHSQDDGVGRDPRGVFVAPRAGTYFLRVHDVGYWGGPEYVYRLTVTDRPFVEYAYPAGGQRGKSTALRVFTARGAGPAGQAGSAEVAQPVTMTAAPGSRLMLFQPAGAANAIPLAVGDVPEALEEEPNDSTANRVSPPLTLNGRLERPGDVDRAVFSARKGEPWFLECVAERIQSPARARLTLTGPDGRRVAEAAASAGGDPRLTFTAPADGDYTVSIRDLHGAVRGGPSFVYRLEVRPAAPDFQLLLAKDYLDVKPGEPAALDLAVTRSGGFAGPILLEATGLPPGLTLQPGRIEAGQDKVKLVISAPAGTEITDGTVRLVGRGEQAGGELRRPALAPYIGAPAGLPTVGPRGLDTFLVSVTHPPLFAVETDDTFTYSPKGTVYPARLKISRQPGFNGEVRVRIADRQIRELDGFDAEERSYSSGVTDAIYPVSLPETMDLSRPSSRVYVLGTAIIQGKDGRRHGLLAVSPKQIVIKSQPALLALSADRPVVEARRGTGMSVTLTLHRTPKCTEAADLRLELPQGARGITMMPVRIAAGEKTAVVHLNLAPDAVVPDDSRLRIGARCTLNGYPVEAFAHFEVDLLAPGGPAKSAAKPGVTERRR